MSTKSFEEIVAAIPKQRIKSILKDPASTAKAIHLEYVNDSSNGIIRKQKVTGFDYFFQGKKIVDEKTLKRIKSLVIPPAWQDVWISEKENAHLQATGLDAKSRKQYRYHPGWNMLRNHTKFFRLSSFGEVIPKLRLQVEKDLDKSGLQVEKVLATVVSLMERTNIRVGNCSYEKANGSYGITTLKDKHVKINGQSIRFSFKGKKGVYHDISIKNKKLSAIVKKCQDIPGKELFQYLDDEGNRKSIDSGLVNDYIKQHTGGDFTAKDLRTWSGTVQALLAFKELGMTQTEAETKRNILAALENVSKALGNTRTVCKKYYVHPMLIALYETNSLHKYFDRLDREERNDQKANLTNEEMVLMEILKSN